MNYFEKKFQRRDFISKIGKLSALSFVAPISIKSIGRNAIEKESFVVDPITAITIAKTSLDIISTFSGSKDSAMAAMMRYQIALLQNIIKQLTQVQSKLIEIQNSIKELPEQFKESLEQQFKIELISEVQAAAQRYTTNVLIPSLTNPSIIQNSEVKNEINNIIFIVDQKISALALLDGGIGAQACMIAPLAMSINIACRSSLNYPKEVIYSTLIKYQRWFQDMLSDKKGSIMDQINESFGNHDLALSKLDNDRLAIRLGLNNFKLNGSQKGNVITDPGIIFSVFGPGQILGINFDSFGGTYNAQSLSPALRAIFRINSNIETYQNNELGGLLIRYKRSTSRIFSKDDTFSFQHFEPKNGEYYYVQKIDIDKKYQSNVIINMVQNGKTIAKVDDLSRANIELRIAEANLERSKLCFCAQANIVAHNSLNRIQEYLNVLG